jgi:hypothetical protein
MKSGMSSVQMLSVCETFLLGYMYVRVYMCFFLPDVCVHANIVENPYVYDVHGMYVGDLFVSMCVSECVSRHIHVISDYVYNVWRLNV